jgi:hypothetical protein
MELKHLIVLIAGIFSCFVASIKLTENEKLKKENRELKRKLGKI